MTDALSWWLAIEVVGLVGLPITILFLRRLPDAGYAFAKPLSLLLGGYIFWLALSLHIMPNRPGSVVWAFLIVAAVSAVLLRLRGEEIKATFQDRLPVIVAVEVLFGVAFALG